MKDLTHQLVLEDYDEENWKKKSVNLTVDDENGAEKTINCDIIESVNSQTYHKICFTILSKAYRPSKIDIPIYSLANGKLTILIDENELDETFEIKAASPKNPKITHISQEITGWTEKQQQTKLELHFELEKKQSVAIILDSREPSLISRVVQEWDFKYFTKAALFFGLFNLTIIGLVALIAAHLRWVSASLQFYAFIVTAVSAVLGLLGLTELLKFPFQQKIRYLYAKTHNKRMIYLSVLGVLALITFTGVGFIGHSIWMRLTYKNLIDKALNDRTNLELSNRAFKMIPWRLEAPAIIEAQIRSARNSDMNYYRSMVGNFTSDPEIKNAVERSSKAENLPFYLVKRKSDLNIPAVWFAGLIIESDAVNLKSTGEEAKKMLLDLKDKSSNIQLNILEINDITNDLRKAFKNSDLEQQRSLYQKLSEAITKLENIVGEIETTGTLDEQNSFYYQLACDVIANTYTNLCQNPENNKGMCFEKASNYFRKEISARANAVGHHNILWLRPPDKLVLYQLFTFETDPNPGQKAKEAINVTNALKERLKYCYCQSIENENWKDDKCYNEGIKKQVLDEFKSFQQQNAWLKGSSSFENGEDFKKRIETLLEEGWRY